MVTIVVTVIGLFLLSNIMLYDSIFRIIYIESIMSVLNRSLGIREDAGTRDLDEMIKHLENTDVSLTMLYILGYHRETLFILYQYEINVLKLLMLRRVMFIITMITLFTVGVISALN